MIKRDVPINTYKENFKGTISFISVDKTTGKMNIAFQILLPESILIWHMPVKEKSMAGSSSVVIIQNKPIHCWK